MVNASKVEQLVGMGYSVADATKALKVAMDDIEQAVGFLLMSHSARGAFGGSFTGGADEPRISCTSSGGLGLRHMANSWGKGAMEPLPENTNKKNPPPFAADEPNGKANEQSTPLGAILEGDGFTPRGSFAAPVFEAASSMRSVASALTVDSSMPWNRKDINTTDPKAKELMDMGFTAEQAVQALKVSFGDLEQAVGFLLMGDSKMLWMAEKQDSFNIGTGGNDAELAARMQDEERRHQQEFRANQRAAKPRRTMGYSMLGNIHSNYKENLPKMVVASSEAENRFVQPFCTCLAASKFLDGGMVNEAYLSSIVTGGMELFNKAGEMDDFKVQTVLEKCGKEQNLGIASKETKKGEFSEMELHSERGLRNKLAQIREAQRGANWQVAILDVAGAYSFCICLPAKNTANRFWLFDFVARPEFKAHGAYARVHTSLLQMEESLEYVMKIRGRRDRKESQPFEIYEIMR